MVSRITEQSKKEIQERVQSRIGYGSTSIAHGVGSKVEQLDGASITAFQDGKVYLTVVDDGHEAVFPVDVSGFFRAARRVQRYEL